MQFTAAVAAAMLAVAASASFEKNDFHPDHVPECSFVESHGLRVKTADCLAACTKLNDKSHIEICDEVNRTQYDYATHGSCKVVVTSTDGKPQCQSAYKVIEAVGKNLAVCSDYDGEYVTDAEFDYGDGVTIQLQFNDGKGKAQ